MPDNEPSPQKAQPTSAGHVPITEELDSPKRTLPPAAPVAIALVLVAAVVAIVAYTERAKPAVQGNIDAAYFSQPANMPSSMILLDVTLRNVSDQTLYIKDIKADVKTEQGDQSDEAASASDYGRYLEAYPDLKGHNPPLEVEMKIPPGAVQKGSVMISLPITKDQFAKRKDVTVTIIPYDQKPIVLRENQNATKP